jgi:hypothetical protein
MKRYFKMLFEKIVPFQGRTILTAVRGRILNKKLIERWGITKVNCKLFQHFGFNCVGGLFAGLTLPDYRNSEHMGPFLLGTYEDELAPWFRKVKTQSFSGVLDVGAKFGYYAVGLAQWFPDIPVMAFDIDPWARMATRKVAKINRTSNVKCLGFCSPEWLRIHLQPSALIISDCEGFEFQLFNPQVAPVLATATLIIELHDSAPWSQRDSLIERFKMTHDIEELHFDTSDRRLRCKVDISFLDPDEQALAVCEPRDPWQRWVFLQPKRANL